MTQTQNAVRPLPRFATIANVSDMLGGRSRASIYRDIAEGRLPQPKKFGRRTVWPAEELVEFLRASIEAR